MNTLTGAKSDTLKAEKLTATPATELVRLMVGAHFTFPNEPGRVWVKTGQRSARRCHYIRQRVVRFRGWEPVVYVQLQEVL